MVSVPGRAFHLVDAGYEAHVMSVGATLRRLTSRGRDLVLPFEAAQVRPAMSGTLLAPDWWHALGYTDDAALLADQQTAGGIAWGLGDIPSLLLGLALVVGWVRSDASETKRLDRQADRDDDAELRAYNERLDALARGRDRG